MCKLIVALKEQKIQTSKINLVNLWTNFILYNSLLLIIKSENNGKYCERGENNLDHHLHV